MITGYTRDERGSGEDSLIRGRRCWGLEEAELVQEFLVTVAEHLVMVRPHAATSLLRVYIDRKAGKVK